MEELQLINYMLEHKDFSIIKLNNITKDFFAVWFKEFEFIESHYKAYGNVPDKATFLSHFKDFELVEVEEKGQYLVNKLKNSHAERCVTDLITNFYEKNEGSVLDGLKKLQESLKGVSAVSSTMGAGYDVAKEGENRWENYKEVSSNQDGTGMIGIPFNLSTFDEATGGIVEGDLGVIAGRPSAGKSFMGVLLGVMAQKNDYKVAYLSFEMDAQQVAYRYDTFVSHISNKNLTRGLMTIEESKKYKEHLEEIKKKCSFVIYTQKDIGGKTWTPKEVELLIENTSPDLVVIDQLSLMDTGNKRQTERERYVEITRTLKQLAENTQTRIVLLVQANRGAADKKSKAPSIDDLYGSDSTGQDANWVLTIKREENTSMGTLALVKNRRGVENVEMAVIFDVNVGYIGEAANRGEQTAI